MATKAEREFRKIRGGLDDIRKATVTFWIVKQYVKERAAHYNVLRVDIEKRLATRLRGYVTGQLDRDYTLSEYAFSTPDTDDVLLTMDAAQTDFTEVRSAIAEVQGQLKKNFDNGRVTNRDQLLDSWAYVLELQWGSEQLFAWRKISGLTQPKMVRSTKVLLFYNEKLTDLDDDQVFLIDPHFDFFVLGDLAFIANKRQFEIAMNFREGMKNQRDQLLAEFKSRNILKNVDELATMVGDNLNHLRKLASIKKAGYYKQPDYMARLLEVNRAEGWGLTVDGSQLVAEADKLQVLLVLLNNDRLRSPINAETFDAGAKTKVS